MKKMIKVILLAICIISGVIAGTSFLRKQSEERKYEELRESVFQETQPETLAAPHTEEATTSNAQTKVSEKYTAPDGLLGLMDSNESVIGWIKISDTQIDYPLVQNNEDNEYFLHRDINGEKSFAGSVYLDSDHTLGKTTLNVIYGHNMKNGSMFKDISKYVSKDYMDSHSDIKVFTDKKQYNLKPVYCYIGEADGSYRNKITSTEEVSEFLCDITGQSFEAGNYFVFITCSYTTGSDNERTFLICQEETV